MEKNMKSNNPRSFIPSRLVLALVVIICQLPCFAANDKNWQRKEVDMRLGRGRRIRAIHYLEGKQPKLRDDKTKQIAKKISKTVRKTNLSLKSEQISQQTTQIVVANVIESPPVDGFIPWIAVTVTDRHGSEDDTVAETHMSHVGRPLNDDPNNFTIGLFDTGASAHIMSNHAGIRLGIYEKGLLTPTAIEVIGVTGSVFPWVSYPLGLFIDGLDAIEPNSPSEPNRLVLNTSEMVGQSNVSILVGDTPPSDGNDLPTAIGAPMAVNFTTSIRNDQPITVKHQGITYTAPKIDFYDPYDWDIPEYDTSISLNVIPLGSIQVAYIWDLEAIFDLIFRPGTPSIMMGASAQSLFFVSSVDLYNNDHEAIDKNRFMLDTGAQVTVVGERVGARLGLDPGNPDFWVEVVGVTGESQMVPGFFIDKLEMPALGEWLSFTDVPVILLDIASPEGGTLDGIIGMNLFTQYNMILHGSYSAPSLEVELITQNITADIAPSQGDGVVDFKDFAVFAQSWAATVSPQSPNWNEKCDIAPIDVPDGIIDTKDLVIFADQWLLGL